MDTVIRAQNLNQACYISLSTCTFAKGMNLTILPPVIGKLDRMGSLTLVWQPVQEKENSEFKPVKLCLEKNIDPVSHPACAEGSVNK